MSEREPRGIDETLPMTWRFESNDGELTARLYNEQGETGKEEVGSITLKLYPEFAYTKFTWTHPTYRSLGVSKILGQKADEYIKSTQKIGLSKDMGDIPPGRAQHWRQVSADHPAWFVFIPATFKGTPPDKKELERMMSQADPAYMERYTTIQKRN